MRGKATGPKLDSCSLLDLCQPPSGYIFVRGAWATHDLDLLAVSELIAPALVGSVATERRQRRLQGRSFPEDRSRSLLIFPCVERQALRGIVPWCHVYPVGGRRQHAKFALLQFENERGGKTITRAIVTSANLTSSGIRRNREILAWEDVGSLRIRGSIAPALLREFRLFGHGECEAAFDAMSQALKCAELTTLRSSVGAPRPLLTNLGIQGRAKRIVVVSPPFASDADDEPVQLLAKYIGPRTAIEIYTGAHLLQGATPTKRSLPEFSSAIISAFSQRTGDVQVYAVPELIPDQDEPDERPPMHRTLHAKLLALVSETGDVQILCGSANFTRSALSGKNRELMFLTEDTEANLDALLESLHAVPCELSAVRPTQVVADHSQTAEPIRLTATFTIDPNASPQHTSQRGTLTLSGDELPVAIQYRGVNLKPSWEQKLLLHESDTGLKVKMKDGRSEQIPIVVCAESEEFWSRIPHEDEDIRPDTSWQHLLLDLRRKYQASAKPAALVVQPGASAASPHADGFYIPLEQRLVTLARHRHRLRSFAESGELEQQLNSYFEGQEAPKQVACALLAASANTRMDKKDALLVALRDAVHCFPNKKDSSHA